jgi:hypothetical protein
MVDADRGVGTGMVPRSLRCSAWQLAFRWRTPYGDTANLARRRSRRSSCGRLRPRPRPRPRRPPLLSQSTSPSPARFGGIATKGKRMPLEAWSLHGQGAAGQSAPARRSETAGVGNAGAGSPQPSVPANGGCSGSITVTRPAEEGGRGAHSWPPPLGVPAETLPPQTPHLHMRIRNGQLVRGCWLTTAAGSAMQPFVRPWFWYSLWRYHSFGSQKKQSTAGLPQHEIEGSQSPPVTVLTDNGQPSSDASPSTTAEFSLRPEK